MITEAGYCKTFSFCIDCTFTPFIDLLHTYRLWNMKEENVCQPHWREVSLKQQVFLETLSIEEMKCGGVVVDRCGGAGRPGRNA